jgi:aminoglycoside phosphotransferase (APT) family kinase protein
MHEIPDEINNFLGYIEDITFPKQGYTSDVVVLTTEKGKFVVKRARGKQFSAWLSREGFVLNVLAKTKLPVPKLFHQVTEENQSWTLTEFMEGQTLRGYLLVEDDKRKRHEAIFSFGEMLASIHKTVCPGELKAERPWLDERLDTAQYYLEHYEIEGTRSLLDKLKRERPAPHPQTLIHGDYTIDNVLVVKGKVTSVIDWSGGAYGDPRYDVSLAVRPKRNAFENEEDKEIFYEGYGQKIITEQDYMYFEDGLYAFF